MIDNIHDNDAIEHKYHMMYDAGGAIEDVFEIGIKGTKFLYKLTASGGALLLDGIGNSIYNEDTQEERDVAIEHMRHMRRLTMELLDIKEDGA